MILLILSRPGSNHRTSNSPSLPQHEFVGGSVPDSKRDEDDEDEHIDDNLDDLMTAALTTDLDEELEPNGALGMSLDDEKL